MSDTNSADARKALLKQALSKIEELKVKLAKAEQFRDAPIAVIGMGCRFPGEANSPEKLWQHLAEGRDLVTEVPPDRWDNDAWYDPDPDAPGKTYSRHGGFLGKVDGFDAAFFGIAPRDAIHMDPQHRLLLECTWEALERAGIPPDRLAGSRTGVFVGMTSSDYGWLINERQSARAVDAYYLTGISFNFAAGRTAYVFGLQGPTMTVDTACSSSLVTVHLACQSLRAGDSDLALASGTNLMLGPLSHVVMSKVRVLSAAGRCRTFDAAADGLVRSEGVGVLVLKRLSDALAAGDNVLAVIRGTAVNQDGPSGGLTVPSKQAQERVIRDALENAKVHSHEVSYVEAHGTGTQLGDPIELRALGAAYGKDRPADNPLYVGSVKTNFGHAEPAAGVAGMMKVILSLQNRALPSHLHFTQPNPNADWSSLGVAIPTRLTPWSRPKRIAGVSAFGASGTNAHIVLEEAPPMQPRQPAPVRPEVLVLSARSEAALTALAKEYVELLKRDGAAPVADLSAAAAVRRMHHDHRLAAVGETHAELAEALAQVARGEPHPFVSSGRTDREIRRKVVFVFPGQGSQWAGMGRELLEQEPVFKRAIERCAEAMAPHVDWSLLDELRAEVPSERIDVVQPTLFAMEVGLAALWRSWGVEPDAVIGHSMGETAASYVAGALSLEDAARIICRRSKLLREVSGRGAMAVVELGMEEAQARLKGIEDKLSVAVSNGPRSTVLSGDADALEVLLGQLEKEGIFCRRVKVTVASHSPQMDPLRQRLLEALHGLQPRAGTVPLYSTVTAQVATGEGLNAAYWVDNLREPVRFLQMVQRLLDDEHSLFVEVSPHPILLPAVEQIFADRRSSACVVGSLRREQPARRTLLKSLGDLYAQGAPIDWTKAYPAAPNVPLPTYPFQRERYWVDDTASGRRGRGAEASASLMGEGFESSVDGRARFWQRWISTENAGFLGAHLVQGMPMVPATVYPLLAVEAARRALGAGTYAVEELAFGAPLALGEPPAGERELQLSLIEDSAGRAGFRVASRSTGEPWKVHGAGRVRSVANDAAPSAQEAVESVRARCSMEITGDTFYEALSQRGIANGAALRSVEELFIGQGEALARLRVPAGSAHAHHELPLHPVLLDGALQAVGAALGPQPDGAGVPLPTRIRSLAVWPSEALRAWSHVRVRSLDDDTIEADVRVLDDSGALIAEVGGLRLERFQTPGARQDEALFTTAWRRTEELPAPSGTTSGGWLVVSRESDSARALGALLEAQGQQVCHVQCGEGPLSAEQLGVRLREALGGTCRGAVYLAPATPSAGAEAEALAALARSSEDVLALSEALKSAGGEPRPRLWIITRGAQAMDSEAVSLAQTALWGLGASLPTGQSARIDLGPGAPLEPAVRELLAASGEDEIVLRPGARYVARLERPQAGHAVDRVPARGRPFRLEVGTPGALDSLGLRASERRTPGRGEVELRVQVAGLGFSDGMKALGLYPAAPGEKPVLGLECAGQVVAVGEGVEGLQVGQEVFGLAAGSLGAYATVPAYQVMGRPQRLSAEQAATVTMAFTTAWHALHEVARIQRGERVLIHCGASGVGLAAVQLARQAGAEVFATTSSPEKRAFLHALGVARVMDSRSLLFAEEVLAATSGEGVDVVLSSLAGEAIEKGLSVLASDGRFLDLGKRDLNSAHRTLSLGLLRKRISYHVIDLLGLARERPARFRPLLERISRGFESGELSPLPVRAFPAARAAEAIRALVAAQHVGKLAVSVQDDAEALVAVPARPWAGFAPEAGYLLATDAPATGAWLLRWMVEGGARRVVVATPPEVAADVLDAAVREATTAGANVEWARVSLRESRQLERLLDDGEQRGHGWKGVFYAPTTGEAETLARSLELRLAPAVRLDALTRGRSLDAFVLIQAEAATLGDACPPAAVALTTAFAGLAQERRRAGLPALSLDLGRVAPGSEREAGTLLSQALKSGLAQAGVLVPSRAEPGWVSRAAPLPRFSELLAGAGATSAQAAELLSAADPQERRARLEAFVQEQVSLVLRMSREKIDVQTPLKNFGIDSLMGLELRNRLEKALGLRVPATAMWTSPTISDLSGKLLELREGNPEQAR